MAFPTRLDVKNRFWALLDDPLGKVFTDTATGTTPPGPSLFQSAFGEAYDVLYNTLLSQQSTAVEIVKGGIIVAAYPYPFAMTPAQMGINDFADWEWISERTAGSSEKFVDLNDEDRLTQRPATDRLLETVWQDGAFQFVGCTTIRELQIKYVTSGLAPTNDTDIIPIDNSLTFLSNYAAGVVAQRKGYDEVGRRCISLAVGPKFDLGSIGGELFRMIQPMVRNRQLVTVAHKPYTTRRRILSGSRGIPYVAAQQGTTGGGSQNTPVQFSTATVPPTIVGNVDGTNTVFVLTTGNVMAMQVTYNGVLQTVGFDMTVMNNQITFIIAPSAGSTITAEAYISYA